MPLSIADITIPEAEAFDIYGRPIFRIVINGNVILFTKVVFGYTPRYVSFPVKRQDIIVERHGISYELIQSLPLNFVLLQDNGQNTGVIVLTEQQNGFFIENCVLHVEE